MCDAVDQLPGLPSSHVSSRVGEFAVVFLGWQGHGAVLPVGWARGAEDSSTTGGVEVASVGAKRPRANELGHGWLAGLDVRWTAVVGHARAPKTSVSTRSWRDNIEKGPRFHRG